LFYGEIDGKSKASTQSWQQKTPRPLESSAQKERLNKLSGRRGQFIT
jgi:hypothetical protein